MKARSKIITLAIILTPFIIGLLLFAANSTEEVRKKAYFTADTGESGKGLTYKGIKVDWAVYPDWEYKPLFFRAEKYLVFIFRYKNDNERNIQLMPSYSFVSPGHRRYSANEEISMYIEDELEDNLGIIDQTPISFEISPGAVKHYVVTFEKPRSLDNFYVDVDVFRDVTLRINYKKEGANWINYKNGLVKKYKGRG